MDSILEPITETDEHKFCVEMMKRLDIQRRNHQFCDVILEVGSGDDQARLKAHRIVLCAASPFFYNALNSDMKEKKEGVIRLEEMSKAVMEEVLEYLYTGHVDINENNAFDLLAAADYFLIPSLSSLCSKVILQTLTFSKCIGAYYFAVKYRCEELQKGSSDFILTHIEGAGSSAVLCVKYLKIKNSALKGLIFYANFLLHLTALKLQHLLCVWWYLREINANMKVMRRHSNAEAKTQQTQRQTNFSRNGTTVRKRKCHTKNNYFLL